MTNPIKILPKLFLSLLIIVICMGGCKSRKKIVEISKADKANTEQEDALRKQKEEEQRRKEAAEQEKRAAEANLRSNDEKVPYEKVSQYFDAITNAASVTSANNSINEALGLFASPDTPVLIVIAKNGDQKDYDRPTTISEYLHYLKDQKKNINHIENLVVDSSGKITEVELRKN